MASRANQEGCSGPVLLGKQENIMPSDENNQVAQSRKRISIRRVKIVVWIVAIVVAAITIMQNWGSIDTQILFFKITLPRVVFVTLLLLVGFLLGLTAPSLLRRRKAK
jgi:uncharacterized integral membrane protein